jgi:hypothetical protein
LSRTAKIVLVLSFFLPPRIWAGHVELISRTEPGAVPPGAVGTSSSRTISSDGRYVAFNSRSPNLVAGQIDTNDWDDAFLWDRDTGSITLISHAAGDPLRTAGVPLSSAGSLVPTPVISSDGRWVAFASEADDLVPGQIDASRNSATFDVFLWDRQTGTTVLVSHAAGSPTAAGNRSSSSEPLAVGSDGAFVAYTSTATDLVPGGVAGPHRGDIYLWSRATGESTLVSHTAGSPATTGNEISASPSLSADGGFVAFRSQATDLAAGLSDPGPVPDDDVFLWNRSTNTSVLVSHAAGSTTTAANDASNRPALSADGSSLAFLSRATDLIAGQTDQAATPDIFLFDRQAGTLTLVSHAAGAATAAGNSTADVLGPSISADGSRIAYGSASTNLIVGQTDPNGSNDVFLWNRYTGESSLVSHSTAASTRAGNGSSEAPEVSADGSHIAYLSTATDLVAGMTGGNGSIDLFSWNSVSNASVLVSHAAGSPLTGANGTTQDPAAINADGSHIAFTSYASDLAGPSDTNGGSDIFLFSAAPGTNTPISFSPAVTIATVPGLQPIEDSLSADGRYALFRSSSPTIVVGQVDTNNDADLFLVDRAAGTVTLVDHLLGSPVATPDIGVLQAALSADGRWVAYRSEANGIVAGTPNSGDHIYLYDRETGTTLLVSHNGGGFGSCSSFCANPTISDDGRLLVYDNHGNLIAYDRLTDFNSLITHGPVSGSANWNQAPPRISGDGNFVVYLSEMTDLVPGQVDANGNGMDVFVWDRAGGTNTLVSHLPGSPATTGNAPGGRSLPEISRDGRWIVYADAATDLIGGGLDGNNEVDAFLFDRTTGSNSLVSRTASSPTTAANGESAFARLSADGRWISFSSAATDLVSGVTDTNGTYDAFVLDRLTGAVRLVSHRAGAPAAAGNAGSGALDISADGNSIALQTSATDLVAGVTDLNASADLVLIDRPSGFAELASRSLSSPAVTANGWSEPGAAFSADGKVTLFYNDAPDLVAGDYNHGEDLFAYVRSFLDYYTLTPCRLLDTRQPPDGPALVSGATVSLHPLGLCGIPPAARALSLNVTVLGGTGAGHIVLFPGGTAAPETSALNFSAGATRANNAILSLGGDGALAVSPFVSGNGTVHVILDVTGYFQ